MLGPSSLGLLKLDLQVGNMDDAGAEVSCAARQDDLVHVSKSLFEFSCAVDCVTLRHMTSPRWLEEM